MSALPPWFAPLAALTISAVMLSIGLLLGREPIAAALQRRMLVIAIVFAVIVAVPVLALLFVLLTGLRGVVAAGILLMAVSPGAPVALRRAIDVGGRVFIAPALHLAIVTTAVVSVPLSIAVLDLIVAGSFSVSPAQVARQVFVAQLLPLGVGAAVRALWPNVTSRIEPRLASVANLLLIVLLVVCVIVLRRLLAEVGWMPFVGGLVLTVCALGVGTAAAGRDRVIRRQAAVAAAMRNPGLALLVASVNGMPPAVTASIVGYALGATAVVTAYVVWQERTGTANA